MSAPKDSVLAEYLEEVEGQREASTQTEEKCVLVLIEDIIANEMYEESTAPFSQVRETILGSLQELIGWAIVKAKYLLTYDNLDGGDEARLRVRQLVEGAFEKPQDTGGLDSLVFLEDGQTFSPLNGSFILRGDYSAAYDLHKLIGLLSQSALDLARRDVSVSAVEAANEGLE